MFFDFFYCQRFEISRNRNYKNKKPPTEVGGFRNI